MTIEPKSQPFRRASTGNTRASNTRSLSRSATTTIPATRNWKSGWMTNSQVRHQDQFGLGGH